MTKYTYFGVIWLLNKVKIITLGVGTRTNPGLVLHKQMMEFFTMIQVKTEADEDYINTFNLRLQNMKKK